jgi:FMN hydrolase / 5-amino-6-(5-phospho-D-ribitylamino)uracil phosphatase
VIIPRVISLDLDDTLWPVAPVIAEAETVLLAWLRTHHPRAVLGHDVESMRAMRAQIAARFPEHSHDMTFLRRRALAEHFTAAGYPGIATSIEPGKDAPTPIEEALEVFLTERNRVQLYADVLPALARLRTKYRLFALSNGNADLVRCGIGELFDGHITAAGAGAAKPDARMFTRLLREAGVPAPQVLHIGDDPLADVVGATRAGMQAAWLNREARAWPPQFAPPPRTISTLEEIS